MGYSLIGHGQKTGRKRNASRLVTSRLLMVAMLGSMLGGTLFSTRASLAAPQPAVLGTTLTSNQIVVLPDSGAAPTTQSLVSGLPAGAQPHGVAFYGRDNALIGDLDGSRIFVVRVSDATLLDTISTASAGYDSTGTIAVSPDRSTALAMGSASGSDTKLYVVSGPFNASSPITSVTLSGYIPRYQSQAIVFNKAGRAFVLTTVGISVLDAPYTSVAFTIANPGYGAIAITPDGNTLLTTDLSSTVSIFQAPFSAVSTPTSLTIPNGGGVDGIVVAPDGQKAIVVSAGAPQAAAISAPFTASSLVENLPLPTNVVGFEDLSISADGQLALLTGQSNLDNVVLIKAPFTAADATSSAIPIENVSDPTRGAGAVRFRPNFAPDAVANSYAVNEDNSLTVPAAGVLTNDTDIDGDTLTASLVASPSHGTLAFNANGSFSYTPDANYNGSDSFTYKANDGTIDSNTVTVSLTVNSLNDTPVAVGDSYAVNEETELIISENSLLSNDTDADQDTLAVANVTQHLRGALTFNNNSTLTYVPNANYNGTDTFTYQAYDGTVNSNVATVTITVNGVNDAPVASGQSVTTNEDSAKSITLGASDADKDNLTFTIVTAPSHGTLSTGTTSTRTYTPAANFNGSDSFTYKVNDGQADSNTVTVNITVNAVNDAPVTNPDSYSTNEDTPLTVNAPGILSNDTDSEGNALTAVFQTLPAHGSLSYSNTGSFTYRPAANFNGSDSFTYKATDGTLSGNIATITITVNTVNDTPVASSQSVTLAANTSQSITLAATDIDSSSLTYSIASAPSHGTLSGSGANRTYTPNANYIGADSFTFTANDGSANSNIATVSISVEGPVNVTSGIVIERGLFIAAEPFPGQAGLRKQVQVVTLKNKSGAAISGPVYLALDNLTRANLTNASGFTTKAPFGSPYIAVNVGNDSVFSVNEKVIVQLNFTPTSFGTIAYSTRVLAGNGTP